eukprot:1851871-Pyramimonas_sp.AAC.1
MTQGSFGRGLIINVMGGQIRYASDAVKLSGEKNNTNSVLSSQRSSITQQRGVSCDCVIKSTTVTPLAGTRARRKLST